MGRLVRYNPFDDFHSLSSMLDRFIMQAFRETNTDLSIPNKMAHLWGGNFVGDNLPLDVYEMDDAFVIEASVPGIEKDDLKIEMRDGLLTIQASSKGKQELEGSGWRIRERRLHAWQRSLKLPEGININEAHAELDKGILTISLPKCEPHKMLKKRIKVNMPKFKLANIFNKNRGNIHISKN
jgi:HSP20 family protein